MTKKEGKADPLSWLSQPVTSYKRLWSRPQTNHLSNPLPLVLFSLAQPIITQPLGPQLRHLPLEAAKKKIRQINGRLASRIKAHLQPNRERYDATHLLDRSFGALGGLSALSIQERGIVSASHCSQQKKGLERDTPHHPLCLRSKCGTSLLSPQSRRLKGWPCPLRF